MGAPAVAGKKNNNKTMLIALIAVAAVIIVVLIVVLIMMNTGGSNNNTSSNVGGSDNTPVATPAEPEEPEVTPAATGSALSCTRNMTVAEIATLNDALSGSYTISAEFDETETLTSIAKVQSVVYADEDAANNEPVEEKIDEDTAANLNEVSALKYELPMDKDEVDLNFADIQANYEALDYTCEVL